MTPIRTSDRWRHLRSLALPAAIVCALAIGIVYLADSYLDHVIDSTILQEADDRAHVWADEIAAQAPALLRAAEGGGDLAALEAVMASARAHNIFRFKLFAPDGRLILVSDEPAFIAEGGEASGNATALAVLETGASDVSIHDGRGTENRPDTYVEAYVPALDARGTAFGVIEVYVDVSHFSRSLTGVFHDLSLVLILGSAVVYLIPSLVLILRGEQLRDRDRDLLRLSLYDQLTGCLNRRAFADHATTLFADPDRSDVGVIFVDLDRFKTVNDTLGHEFGDHLLTHVATLMNHALRRDDIIGRIGGDEFIILCPGADRETFLGIGERIQAAMEAPFGHGGTTVTPGVSMGVHLSPPGEDEARAMHAADLALYRAKAGGRGRMVEYSEEFDIALRRRRHVEASMRRSLAGHGGFFIEFQPIFRPCGRKVAGFEALLRLRDPEGALISPAEFIPIAEASGLITQIGEKSLKCVLNTANTWPGDVYLAVNLSAVQFKDGTLVDMVRDAIAETGFDAARLELEVTETLLLENEAHVSRQLAGLKKLGLSLSLDDFGTGYSSLGYLWKYRFDKLKIDRVFLEGYDFYSDKYRKVIETIVLLGHSLGMTVTVEGVENTEQLDMLRALGCDQFQGFLLGRPMAVAAARDIITQAEVDAQSA